MNIVRRFARIAAALALSLALPTHADTPRPRPNILLIAADDMGINDLGHVNGGRTQTPSLDRLAAGGIAFSRHYTDSSCSPSRAALLTGLNPTRVGFHPNGLALPDDIVTLPEFLRQHGYRTALFGKWHVGELLSDDSPSRHGFDEWFGMLSHFYLSGTRRNGHLVGERPVYVDPWLQRDDGPPLRYQGHIDALLTERVLADITRPSDKPWFIYVPFLSPHTPTVPEPAFAAKYPDTPEGRYRAVIEQLDSHVGAILKKVADAGQADNTIVIFVSDNGGTGTAFPSNAPLSGEKASYSEGGIRTPLIVSWPGHWTGGRRVDDVKYIADIYPTLVDALGLAPPTPLDGENLFAPRTRPLFWYSQNLWNDSYSVLAADGEWRLQGTATTAELLHYAAGATTPQVADDPAQQARLQREFIDWRNSVTLLPNFGRAPVDSGSKTIPNPFRPTLGIGLAFSLPGRAGLHQVPLIENSQLRFGYSAGRFTLDLDGIVLHFPYRLNRTCNTVYLNFNVSQDNTIFYGNSLVELYVNDDKRIAQEFKIDRLNSAHFSLLKAGDFRTQPRGPVVADSVSVSSRFLTQPEIAPALAALQRTYCGK